MQRHTWLCKYINLVLEEYIVKFKKIKDEGNCYGFDLIEIIKFNYDGEGSALVKQDGELSSYCSSYLDIIMFGDPGSGEKFYQLID